MDFCGSFDLRKYDGEILAGRNRLKRRSQRDSETLPAIVSKPLSSWFAKTRTPAAKQPTGVLFLRFTYFTP